MFGIKKITDDEILKNKIIKDLKSDDRSFLEFIYRDETPRMVIVQYYAPLNLNVMAKIDGEGYVLEARSANYTRKQIKYDIKKVKIKKQEEISKYEEKKEIASIKKNTKKGGK